MLMYILNNKEISKTPSLVDITNGSSTSVVLVVHCYTSYTLLQNKIKTCLKTECHSCTILLCLT